MYLLRAEVSVVISNLEVQAKNFYQRGVVTGREGGREEERERRGFKDEKTKPKHRLVVYLLFSLNSCIKSTANLNSPPVSEWC